MQNQTPPWKPILILVVIALCALSLIQKGVKPGMDLAGGFVLTYEVKVPPGQDATTAIEQIRDVLSQRVDPTGVRNLVWRQAGGNRLEIQAALATAGTFALGAALPLALTWLGPFASIGPLVAGGSLLFLAVLGGLAARAGGASVPVGAARVTFWGALAMAATAFVGSLVGARG